MFRKISLVFLLIFVLSTAGACASAPRTIDRIAPAVTPTPTPDPWQQAVTDAKETLETANLDDHFQNYQETAIEIDTYLAQMEKVRPALDLIDTLKQTELPLLGNVWNLILRALDKAYLGAGVALDQVDEGVRDLLASHERLQRLDQLDQTSAAIKQFQQSPSPETLKTAGEQMAEADFILTGADKDAAELQGKVNGLLTAVDKVQSGLALISGLAPQVQDAVSKIQQFIDDISEPLNELSRTLETLRKHISEDRDVFWQIRDIIHQAETSPQSFQLSNHPQLQ